MLISSPHNLNLCSDSQDTRFLWNVFEAVQKTRSTCFIGSKTTRLRLVALNLIKSSCSFFKHYINGFALTAKLEFTQDFEPRPDFTTLTKLLEGMIYDIFPLRFRQLEFFSTVFNCFGLVLRYEHDLSA